MSHHMFPVAVAVCLIVAGIAHGQTSSSTTATSACGADCKPRSCFPLLGHLPHCKFRPLQAAFGNSAPPRMPEASPISEDVARLLAVGAYSVPEVAAAKIRLDETAAKSRRAAVLYLATVDCHCYPEAETGLIAALRADRLESIRLEAALALGNCKGVTNRILESLYLAALGLDADGYGGEASERVRHAARHSLETWVGRGYPLPKLQSQMLPQPMMFPSSAEYQQVGYYPVFDSAISYWMLLPVSEQERQLAETVSVVRSGQAVQTKVQRPVQEAWQNIKSIRWPFTSLSRDRSVTPASAGSRVHHLRSLGSASPLSIPLAPPAFPPAYSPYNDVEQMTLILR